MYIFFYLINFFSQKERFKQKCSVNKYKYSIIKTNNNIKNLENINNSLQSLNSSITKVKIKIDKRFKEFKNGQKGVNRQKDALNNL